MTSLRGRPKTSSKRGLPPESCKPTTSLQSKVSKAVQLSAQETEQIEKAFDWGSKDILLRNFPPPSSSSGFPNPFTRKEALDDETLEKFCPERHPDFFQGENFYNIDNSLFLKLHFLEWTDQYFVFFVKHNQTDDPSITPSYMRVSAFELNSFICYIEQTLKQIDRVKPDLLQCLKHVNASVFNTKDDNCWDPAFTFTTPSGAIKIRPYRNNIGSYQFKLWQPKPTKTYSASKEWKGPTMTLNKPVVEQFLIVLKKFKKVIEAFKNRTSNPELEISDSEVVEVEVDNDDEGQHEDQEESDPTYDPSEKLLQREQSKGKQARR